MNKLCKSLGIGLLSLPLIYGCSSPKRSSEVEKMIAEEKKAEKRLEQEVKNDVSASIKSVPDPLTDFDETLAEKARKTAQYVVADPKSRYLVSEYGNVILGTINVKGREYKVLVYDFKEGTGRKDYLKINLKRGKKEQCENDSLELKDTGFDGKCDAGTSTINGVFAEEQVYDASLGEVEHRGRYQANYEIALDEINRFYERKKKK